MDALIREAITHYREFVATQVLDAERREKTGHGPGVRWAYNMGRKVGELDRVLDRTEQTEE